MDKLKGFYKNNRVYVILMGLSLFCLAVVLIVVISYFIDQTTGNLFGNRLNGIETVEITQDRMREMEAKIAEDELVERASIRILGKTININIFLNDGKASDGQNIAIKSLDLFTDDEKAFYDISFLVDKIGDVEDTVFPIAGNKKSDNTIISWANIDE